MNSTIPSKELQRLRLPNDSPRSHAQQRRLISCKLPCLWVRNHRDSNWMESKHMRWIAVWILDQMLWSVILVHMLGEDPTGGGCIPPCSYVRRRLQPVVVVYHDICSCPKAFWFKNPNIHRTSLTTSQRSVCRSTWLGKHLFQRRVLSWWRVGLWDALS